MAQETILKDANVYSLFKGEIKVYMEQQISKGKYTTLIECINHIYKELAKNTFNTTNKDPEWHHKKDKLAELPKK